MKNKIIIILFLTFIFIASMLLRLWNLDDVNGLWFDEYVTYNVIDTDSFWRVKELTIGTCQPPLYFWLLWGWMKIFGNADWVLRFLSVILGCFSVIAAYFCGRHLELIQKIDNIPSKTGIIFAVLFAINSMAIYYSQEMRVYSMIALLSTLLLLSILRVILQVNNKNLFFLILVNFILLYTHTLAYAFCFFVFLILFIYFYKKDIINFKKIIISAIILGILCIPGIYDITNNIIDVNSSWTTFNANAIFSFVNAYISPFLFNMNHQGVNIFSFIFFPGLLIFNVSLIIIYFAGLIKTLKNVSISRYLSLACILYLCVLAFLNIQGKISFIPRYGIEVLPFFLLFVSYGILHFKGKFINTKNLLAIIILLNFIFMFGSSEINAQNLSKQIFPTTFKNLSKTLNNYKFQSGDTFAIVYYGSTSRFISARKYYDFSAYKNYLFDHCAFAFKDRDKCLESRKISFENTLQLIKKEISPDKSVVIVIPDDIFDFYEEIINEIHFETKYNNMKKLNENNWVTIIYKN